MQQAQEANLDIAAAVARVVQADAVRARVTGAALLPTAWISIGSASRSGSGDRTQDNVSGFSSGSGGDRNTFSARLSAGYEIDFVGKNRVRCGPHRRMRSPPAVPRM